MSGIVRDYRPGDFEAVRRLHEASGIDYRMPDLNAPLFLVRKVVEVNGVVTACCALRIEAETYLWCGGGPAEKMAAMAAMQPEILDEAWLKGIDNIVCWIPQAVEKRFRKRLLELRWEPGRDGWHSWSRNTEARTGARADSEESRCVQR